MHTCLICIGSNHNREIHVSFATEALKGLFPNIVFGRKEETEPWGISNSALFINQVASFTTELSAEEVKEALKQLETLSGRTPEEKEKGIVSLDIDLLMYDDVILKPDDIKKEYMTKLIPERKEQPPVLLQEKIEVQKPVQQIMRNGIPLSIINAGSQEVIRLDIIYKGGSWHQMYKLQSLFTNRMLREGTCRFSSTEISEKLDFYGAWLELAVTLEYAHVTLYSLNKYFSYALDIIDSLIKEPLFPEKELQTIIETNLQQYHINSTKVDFLAHRSLMASLFGDKNPGGRFPVEEDYKNIHSDMLREFYNQHYHSGNCRIYLSGKISSEHITLVEEQLGTNSFGDTANKVITPQYSIDPVPTGRIFIERKAAMQSAVKLGALTISREHPDYQKLRVLATLFGGYFGSRLMANIREDKGYTYGIGAGLYYYPGTGLFVISTETGNEYVEPLINEIYREMDKLQNETVSSEELSLVQNYMVGEMLRNFESPFSLVDAWIFIHTSGLQDDFFNNSLQTIKKTTPEDIRMLAGCYLKKDEFKVVVVGDNIS